MPIPNEAVMAALATVIEPDLKKDLVTLNMIRDVKTSDDSVSFTVVLTTPACPLKDVIRRDCEQAVKAIENVHNVDVKFDAEVTSGPRRAEGILPGVKNTIAVASGKGGVGKSTIAANLAVALAAEGASVGLVDTDIYGPSVPTMFGITDEKPRVNDERKIIPLEKHGVKLLSMGFLVDPKDAVVWRGPMVTSAVKQFLGDADWGDLDYLILDLPPGTGDIQLTIVQTIPLTGSVIVSTPQDVALADARKGVSMFTKVDVPVLGIVENMAYFTPPDMPDKKYYLFGEGGARKLAEELEVPLLAEIPLEQMVREGGDEGTPAVVTGESASALAFRGLAGEVARRVAIRNASGPATQSIEILYK